MGIWKNQKISDFDVFQYYTRLLIIAHIIPILNVFTLQSLGYILGSSSINLKPHLGNRVEHINSTETSHLKPLWPQKSVQMKS